MPQVDEQVGLPPPSLMSRTTYLAGSLARLGKAGMVATLKDSGLGFPHYAVLMALVDLGPLAPHELATRLNTDRSHVSTYVESLQRSGLIERHPDPSDRRRIIVAITSAGTEIAHDVAAASTEAELNLLSGLAEDERVELRRLLLKVLLSADGWPGAPAASTQAPSC
ncbi:MarR family winged helix-turn-helix transcriptional regulator [Arthrobacter rhombi]|uniref:MarR family winged helix-turn-helix transcriptional regulator n=1 Tax=Arthrobacter rhombi TaxID=71253 RepID=UPI003FD52158